MPQTITQHPKKSPEYYSIVAETISPRILPTEVDELLAHSVAQGLLFHGIRHLRNLDGVKKAGVKPLTPEGGHVSFWGAGSQLFWGAAPRRDEPMWSYNSVFFHYAQLVKTSDDTTKFGLAITANDQLSRADIANLDASPNGECRIPEVVPADLLNIVTVQGMDVHAARENLFRYLLQGARSGVLSAPGTASIHG